MIRPTFRAVTLFAAGIPLAFGMLLADEESWPFVVALLFISCFALLTDAILMLTPGRLSVDVHIPKVLFIGHTDALMVRLQARSQRQTAIEAVCDLSELIARPPPLLAPLNARGEALLTFPLQARRRGTAKIERLWLRWQGPLGLVRVVHIVPLDVEVSVTPNIRAVRQTAIQFSDPNAFYGIKAQRQQGEGSEFEALRDYVPGLDHRSIDWKHSARHRNLVCKEFRTERNHQIVLAFDTGHLMSEPLQGITKLDHAVNASLQLGYVSLRAGDRIGVFGFDSRVRLFSQPSGGVGTFWRLQKAASELSYSEDETNFTLGLSALAGRLNRRSLVILQTEFVDIITAELMLENVERLAARHLVLFVCLQDPGLEETVDGEPFNVNAMSQSVIADEFLRERRIVMERLRRMGVHCLDVKAEQVGPEIINRYLEIKRMELI
ncbi:DUF58 domain-containing protein [Pelagibius litoralis]|uniref:DUF58 domain-containing protein n=1 Tax=Pelagibius litoralis TaxID=374515 RepID=A0A967F295_9PROT|nr:DUF58 domain-containing protein [Pelagibius litoralis]NIA71814.1 DUF58 domain-containing protein [Pelagibius litoralis]